MSKIAKLHNLYKNLRLFLEEIPSTVKVNTPLGVASDALSDALGNIQTAMECLPIEESDDIRLKFEFIKQYPNTENLLFMISQIEEIITTKILKDKENDSII
jgi:hypothetical protein